MPFTPAFGSRWPSSGGPILNERGQVIGISTFKQVAEGGGVAGAVRIHLAAPLLEQARTTIESTEPPSPRLLPAPRLVRLDQSRLEAIYSHFKPYFEAIDPD